ncbi:MAG: NapH/MauN family ferredoxin-type protein [Alphaproteobacteria bacterium]|nr:NapH/MauN family ferredoxin-type protein [Alphaproteobacteria bacterium]
MLGWAPHRPTPEEMSPEARALLEHKRSPAERDRRKAAIQAETQAPPAHRPVWRNRRWLSIALVNLMFVASFQFDIQLVEGALTASRFVGFHMADLNSALQVMLAYKTVVINLVIGTTTVLLMWLLLGGRSFCSWVCPYHLVAELAEMAHLKLGMRDHPMHRGMRTALWLVFSALAVVTGYTVFETISPVGILSRALIYGGGVALVWVGALLLVEIFYTRRFWCRYACPIGLTYGLVGTVSPIKVAYDAEACLHEGECRQVCLVPHVLHMTRMGHNAEVKMDIGADCTRCGLCIDACPTGALKFRVKGLEARS